MASRWTIESDTILLVEGKDEESFFGELGRAHSIRIQVIAAGGKDQFPAAIQALALSPGFERVKSYGVVRDADTDARAAFDSVASAISKVEGGAPSMHAGFVDVGPRRVGIFIVPDGISQGCLETLCLSTVGAARDLECVGDFLQCAVRGAAGREYLNHESRASKARCQAFLSIQSRLLNCAGVAAKASVWDMKSPKLNGLVAFLAELAH